MNRETVFGLMTAVEYQENGIVSRDVIHSENGTITLFAFDKGQELSEHTAPFDACVNVLEGKEVVSIRGVVRVLSAGEAIVMPAGVPHALSAQERFKMLLVMVKKL
jgi:quercetin dioxygenase-like cupin family protein